MSTTRPSTREQKFFSRIRSWTWIKHTILADYLVPWAMKVGSTAPQIFVVDAFAGAGTYKDARTGEVRDGSPVIAARRAQDYAKRRPGRAMRVIAIERDKENFEALTERVACFGELVIARHGSFVDHLEEVTELVGKAPALVLLDPIGLKEITATACRHLLDRAGKTDAFVIVDFQVVHRTAGQLLSDGTPNPAIASSARSVANVDSFFADSEKWRRIAIDQGLDRAGREQAYLALYFENVLSGCFDQLCTYPVRPRFNAPVKYWLVHASNHRDALLLMNDEIFKVDRELYLRTYAVNAITEIVEGLFDSEVEGRETKLRSEALELIVSSGDRGVAFEALENNLLPVYFGQVKKGAYSRAVKTLVKEEKVRREREARAKLEPREVLTAS
ncbi:MAG: three-Cys-motif partner protein TcmP [Gaiellaceae bacterium]